MKLYSAMLSISLGLFFSASAMECGGKVTKETDEDTLCVREVLTQTNEEKRAELVVSKCVDKEKGSVSYSGWMSYPINNETTQCTSFGNRKDKEHVMYQKLEQYWLKLQEQLNF